MKNFILLFLFICPTLAIAQHPVENLDGNIYPEELANYQEIVLTDKYSLYKKIDSDYIYLSIQSQKIYVASLCIENKDQISILHASSALGKIDYQKRDRDWATTEDFNWGMREGEMDEETIQKRLYYLEEFGWVANTMDMGEVGNTEFILERSLFSEPRISIAAGLIPASNPEFIIPIPSETAGECASNSLVAGSPDEEYSFDPDSWIKINLSN
ncbi:MAG: hypothetical protein JJ971_12685 [Balneolaceae bacterium]|nr:hypothetical protein [Balneolaceae bacterium]MBO6547291.1 hypothetical protein [Balneolaceae bacterium]MBO6647762.1 hypothetical protein [Balneolaceae bacterium]